MKILLILVLALVAVACGLERPNRRPIGHGRRWRRALEDSIDHAAMGHAAPRRSVDNYYPSLKEEEARRYRRDSPPAPAGPATPASGVKVEGNSMYYPGGYGGGYGGGGYGGGGYGMWPYGYGR